MIFELSLPQTKLTAEWEKKVLQFKSPAGTSRGVLHTKDCFFLYIKSIESNQTNRIIGTGECSPIWGLSLDNQDQYEPILNQLCKDINNYKVWLNDGLESFPSILFGLEMALKSLEQKGSRILFPSNFTHKNDSIKINGLVWMGDIDFMKKQIDKKIEEGYNCIKLKIGALNFESEIELIQQIRLKYSKELLEIRVDANGGFEFNSVMEKLKKLANLGIHSIEQPIPAGNWEQMSLLCETSPIPIALDEELIGVSDKYGLLEKIKPQYIILKPSLLGGFSASEQWILAAEKLKINWWITSALESNIGLNAIAQFTYCTKNKLPQGLGTGAIYKKNIGKGNCLIGDKFFFKSVKVLKTPKNRLKTNNNLSSN